MLNTGETTYDGRLRPPRARVVIADDHELARSGLRAMLEGEDDLDVVGEAADGMEALALCRAAVPDLALLDLRMPRLDGLATAREIRSALPSVRILVVTMHESMEHLQEALKAGAAGYVLKDASRHELLAAVRAVLRGQGFVGGALAARLVQQRLVQEGGPPRPAGEPLTARETEVLVLVAQGLTNKQIAQQLAVAPGTAKIHVERLIAKLGVADRTQAAVRAVSLGLVAAPKT